MRGREAGGRISGPSGRKEGWGRQEKGSQEKKGNVGGVVPLRNPGHVKLTKDDDNPSVKLMKYHNLCVKLMRIYDNPCVKLIKYYVNLCIKDYANHHINLVKYDPLHELYTT